MVINTNKSVNIEGSLYQCQAEQNRLKTLHGQTANPLSSSWAWVFCVMSVCVCVHMCEEVRGQPQLLSLRNHSPYLRQELSVNLELAIRLDELATEPQGQVSASPALGLIGVSHPAQL